MFNFVSFFLKNQERKIEMMEKNHKHELGVELAHHKEVQRNLIRLNEENRELKVKLEVKLIFIFSSIICSHETNSIVVMLRILYQINKE